MIEANTLLRQLVGTIAMRPDPEAPDGMAIEIRGDLSRILSSSEELAQKSAPKGALLSASKIAVVAGVGFEPTTFRL